MWPERFILVDDVFDNCKNWDLAIKNHEWIEMLLKYQGKECNVSEDVQLGNKPIPKQELCLFWTESPARNDVKGTREKLLRLKDFLNENSTANVNVRNIYVGDDSDSSVAKSWEIAKNKFQSAVKQLKEPGPCILWLDFYLSEAYNDNDEKGFDKLIEEKFNEISTQINPHFLTDLKSDYQAYGGVVLSNHYNAGTEDPVRVLVPASHRCNYHWLERTYGGAVTSSATLRGNFHNVFYSIFLGLDRWIELTIRHPLDIFWKETKDWFNNKSGNPHEIEEINDKWIKDMKEKLEPFLGPINDWFSCKEAYDAVHENLKTLAGARSFFVSGTATEPLSTYAAYIVFLMGAHYQLKNRRVDVGLLENAKKIVWKKKEGARAARLFSGKPQSGNSISYLHKKCAKAIFGLGKCFALHQDRKGICPIEKPYCCDKILTVRLRIRPQSGRAGYIKFATMCKDAIQEGGESKPGLPFLIRELHESGILGGEGGGKILFECLQETEDVLLMRLIHSDHRSIALGVKTNERE